MPLIAFPSSQRLARHDWTDTAGLVFVGAGGLDWKFKLPVRQGHPDAEGAVGIQFNFAAHELHPRVRIGGAVDDHFGIDDEPESAVATERLVPRPAHRLRRKLAAQQRAAE